MVSVFSAFILLFFYIVGLYFIARWGETNTGLAEKVKNSSTTYALSLAVYCTSWTYYGNIGQASSQGINHVALYLGSSLTFILFSPLLKKMIRLKKAYHSTSIADFISTRYNNSQSLAALITVLCLIGITPYISIQLKAIITTFNLITNSQLNTQHYSFLNLEILIVIVMIVFTIIFGVRRLDPTERHPGMVIALAGESIFKLFALLCSGFFICFMVFNGLDDIFNTVNLSLAVEQKLQIFTQTPAISSWFTSIALGFIGIIALPRQFHIGIVECSNEQHLERAKWLFPLYLFVINLLVLPIAMAGLLVLPQGSNGDLFLLQMPLLENQTTITALVFLGGFAASTGMIMLSAMTLSTMATNHLIIPIIEYIPRLQFLRRYILQTRWAVVSAILFLSLFYYRVIGNSAFIVNIGSISFVAIAQLIPVLIGGLVWKKGNIYGAISGLICGGGVWFYTSLLPSVIRSGWWQTSLLNDGLFGLPWLKPTQLFGLHIESTLGHSLFWSLFINICLYILVSECKPIKNKEQLNQLQKFFKLGIEKQKPLAIAKNLNNNIQLDVKQQLLTTLFNRYLPESSAKLKIKICCEMCQINDHRWINVLQLSQLQSSATNMLAGIIGMASANKTMKSLQLFGTSEQTLLASSYSYLLAQSQMTPDELLEKIDFYQEKQYLLEDHAKHQEQIISKLELEQAHTMQAKAALKALNNELENRVNERTKQLTRANYDLTQAMVSLQNTQDQLVESEKMASLGALVAGVAHEINTPIGVVLTAITSLENEEKQLVDLYQKQHIRKHDMDKFFHNVTEGITIALNNIKRATSLIESFKQVAVDQTSEQHRVFNVYQYIESILLSLKPKLKNTQHQITIDCEPSLTIDSYPGALSQILSNLILNSLLHGFNHNEKGQITITVKLLDNVVQLDYHDNGVGLSNEGKKNIFEPFYTTKRGSGGSGLGAHIIYNIVTQGLNGNIGLDQQTSTGLGFNISFPTLT
jgi:Na+/proline symporter/signal transduction histidine kinase